MVTVAIVDFVNPVRIAVVVALVVTVVAAGLAAAFDSVFVVDVIAVLVAATVAFAGAVVRALDALFLAEVVTTLMAVFLAAFAMVFVVVYATVSVVVRWLLVKTKWYSSFGWNVARKDRQAAVGVHQIGITGQSNSTGFGGGCVSGANAVRTESAAPAPTSRNSKRKSILHSYGFGDFFGR
jgi:hypothetical protein